MACATEAARETVQKLGSAGPERDRVCPAAIVGDLIGMKGRDAPRSLLDQRTCCVSKVSMPPIPEPIRSRTEKVDGPDRARSSQGLVARHDRDGERSMRLSPPSVEHAFDREVPHLAGNFVS